MLHVTHIITGMLIYFYSFRAHAFVARFKETMMHYVIVI
jgi:hypothetical protein